MYRCFYGYVIQSCLYAMLDSAVIPSDVTSLCVIPVLFRERRAARRAALGITEPEQEEPPAPTRTERSRPRADSKTNTNDRSNLEVSSPTNGRQRSPRSSPRPSPRSSPTLPRRRFKYDEPQVEGEISTRIVPFCWVSAFYSVNI